MHDGERTAELKTQRAQRAAKAAKAAKKTDLGSFAISAALVLRIQIAVRFAVIASR
jgi:hypothetical protein